MTRRDVTAGAGGLIPLLSSLPLLASAFGENIPQSLMMNIGFTRRRHRCESLLPSVLFRPSFLHLHRPAAVLPGPGPMRTWRKSVNILASTFPLFDVPWALLFLTNCIHCCRNFGHPMEVWKVVGLPSSLPSLPISCLPPLHFPSFTHRRPHYHYHNISLSIHLSPFPFYSSSLPSSLAVPLAAH